MLFIPVPLAALRSSTVVKLACTRPYGASSSSKPDRPVTVHRDHKTGSPPYPSGGSMYIANADYGTAKTLGFRGRSMRQDAQGEHWLPRFITVTKMWLSCRSAE